jgi:hypothetical protein
MSVPLLVYGAGVVNADTVATKNTVAQRDNNGQLNSQIQKAVQQTITAAFVAGVNVQTATYTALATDFLILCNATGGAITLNLPVASASTGQILIVKKTDSSGNAVTLTPAGADVIDGASTKAISSQYGLYAVMSDGTTWNVIFKI